jgi:hypothetical protein
VRGAESRVLVVRGEAGIGKTALLRHLQDRAADCRLAGTVGVESETLLAFAGLDQLCAPMLDGIDHLPPPQAAALRTTFGLTAGPPPDPFLLGLATLGLLTLAAEDEPLVCLVDDAQWLDQATATTLGFVARRLGADPVALVFAVREPIGAPALDGLPTLAIGGLGDADARSVIDQATGVPVDERVRTASWPRPGATRWRSWSCPGRWPWPSSSWASDRPARARCRAASSRTSSDSSGISPSTPAACC